MLIPCHRVTGGNRALTGYAGRLPAKKTLLDWEADVR
ncbi:MGMT family protein [Bacteroides zhangwenhongii]